MTRLRATTLFSSRRLTITAIESVAFRVDNLRHARWVTGHLDPVAVIVKERGRSIAYDMDGRAVDPDSLGLSAEVLAE